MSKAAKRKWVGCPHCEVGVAITPKGFIVKHKTKLGEPCPLSEAPLPPRLSPPPLQEGEPLWMALLEKPIRKL